MWNQIFMSSTFRAMQANNFEIMNVLFFQYIFIIFCQANFIPMNVSRCLGIILLNGWGMYGLCFTFFDRYFLLPRVVEPFVHPHPSCPMLCGLPPILTELKLMWIDFYHQTVYEVALEEILEIMSVISFFTLGDKSKLIPPFLLI